MLSAYGENTGVLIYVCDVYTYMYVMCICICTPALSPLKAGYGSLPCLSSTLEGLILPKLQHQGPRARCRIRNAGSGSHSARYRTRTPQLPGTGLDIPPGAGSGPSAGPLLPSRGWQGNISSTQEGLGRLWVNETLFWVWGREKSLWGEGEWEETPPIPTGAFRCSSPQRRGYWGSGSPLCLTPQGNCPIQSGCR